MTMVSDSVSIYVQNKPAMCVRGDDIMATDSRSFIKGVHVSIKYSHGIFRDIYIDVY